MENKSWKMDLQYENAFSIYKKFNSTFYKLTTQLQYHGKTIKYWVFLSSGKKRKEFNYYENKPNKSDGGIKALLWAKEKIFSFHEFFISNYCIGNEVKNFYICLKWADSKRRNVYSRLIKYGFYFMYDEGEKILMKKI